LPHASSQHTSTITSSLSCLSHITLQPHIPHSTLKITNTKSNNPIQTHTTHTPTHSHSRLPRSANAPASRLEIWFSCRLLRIIIRRMESQRASHLATRILTTHIHNHKQPILPLPKSHHNRVSHTRPSRSHTPSQIFQYNHTQHKRPLTGTSCCRVLQTPQPPGSRSGCHKDPCASSSDKWKVRERHTLPHASSQHTSTITSSLSCLSHITSQPHIPHSTLKITNTISNNPIQTHTTQTPTYSHSRLPSPANAPASRLEIWLP
jgi:hypothetical protein